MILSIDAISLLLHISTALYVREIWVLSELSNKKMWECFHQNAETVLELQFDRSSNILICKKNSVYDVYSSCTFRLAILKLKDRRLDYSAHKYGVGLSTQRFTSLGTALTDMISSVYNFLVLNFCTQGFLWGVLLCLKIGSWKEMNRVIFLWMLLFFCPSFSA